MGIKKAFLIKLIEVDFSIYRWKHSHVYLFYFNIDYRYIVCVLVYSGLTNTNFKGIFFEHLECNIFC